MPVIPPEEGRVRAPSRPQMKKTGSPAREPAFHF